MSLTGRLVALLGRVVGRSETPPDLAMPRIPPPPRVPHFDELVDDDEWTPVRLSEFCSDVASSAPPARREDDTLRSPPPSWMPREAKR